MKKQQYFGVDRYDMALAVCKDFAIDILVLGSVSLSSNTILILVRKIVRNGSVLYITATVMT